MDRLTARWWVAGWVVVGASFLVGCQDRQEKAVGGLAESGFGFSVRDYLRAAAQGNFEVVEMYLAAGMAVDAASASGETALMRAVENRHFDLVDHLLARGANADVSAELGETIALKAARSGDADLVRKVLEHGADPTLKNSEGWSPLTVAAFEGRAPVVKVLAPKCRAFLDDALQLAAVSGSTEVADVLMNHGASVFARSPDNRTALMYAAENGNLEMAKLLLRNGANRFALDDEDQTASDLASLSGHSGIAEYLQEPRLPEEGAFDESGIAGWDEHGAGTAETVAATEPADWNGQPGGAGGPGAEVAVEPGGGALSIDGIAPGDPDSEDGVPARPRPGAGRSEPAFLAASGPATTATPSAGRPVAPRIDGAVIPLTREGTPMDLDQEARLAAYRETQLPVMLSGVDEGSSPEAVGRAEVRVLYGSHSEPVNVAVGETVPDTELEVVSVRKRFVYSKQGKGEATDVSEMILMDHRTGTKHLVRKDFPAGASETYAVMRLSGGGTYDVRTQDEFTVEGQPAHYRVIDVRPTQIVIEDTVSGEAITVERFGTAAR